MKDVSRPPRDSSGAEPGRRRFLKRGLAAGAALATATRAAAAATDPSKVLGAPKRPYGERSRFERAARQFGGAPLPDEWGPSFTPLGESVGIITPSSLHYEVHRGGVPEIDPTEHRLLVHGLVDRPVILTVQEIKRLPSVSRIYFL